MRTTLGRIYLHHERFQVLLSGGRVREPSTLNPFGSFPWRKQVRAERRAAEDICFPTACPLTSGGFRVKDSGLRVQGLEFRISV